MANHIHGIIGFDENGVGGHIMRARACQDCNETYSSLVCILLASSIIRVVLLLVEHYQIIILFYYRSTE